MAERLLNVLVVDDDPIVRNLMRSILKDKASVFAVETPSIGFRVLENESIDILICDFRLPEMNGLQVLEKVKTEYPDIEVIMISSMGDMDTVIEALRKGAIDYFRKPFTPPELWVAIERTKKFRDLNQNLQNFKSKNKFLQKELNSKLGNTIIGSSKPIEEIKRMMQRVAQTDNTSVLIIGESGTGKELVARGIHMLGNRAGELFGAVNMSAVPESLFESEFFGHKKGSFTGAINDKAGWFETADRGTLFFDEIGEMSMALQVKLLRVLEDRKYVKVGHQKEQAFDIRIVAATNKSVEELSDGKSFRSDLFHRLGTFIIQVPPLRERKEDIPALIRYFFDHLNDRMGKRLKGVNDDVYPKLLSYSFPGNIRELRNMVERAMIICDGDILLPVHFQLSNVITDVNQPTIISGNEEIYDLAELERITILKALKISNNNKSEAARLLNIEWNALYRRMQKYKIEL